MGPKERLEKRRADQKQRGAEAASAKRRAAQEAADAEAAEDELAKVVDIDYLRGNTPAEPAVGAEPADAIFAQDGLWYHPRGAVAAITVLSAVDPSSRRGRAASRRAAIISGAGYVPDCFGGSPVHNRSVSLASTRGFSSGIHGALVTVASSSRALRRRKPAERVVPWMCERETVIVP